MCRGPFHEEPERVAFAHQPVRRASCASRSGCRAGPRPALPASAASSRSRPSTAKRGATRSSARPSSKRSRVRQRIWLPASSRPTSGRPTPGRSGGCPGATAWSTRCRRPLSRAYSVRPMPATMFEATRGGSLRRSGRTDPEEDFPDVEPTPLHDQVAPGRYVGPSQGVAVATAGAAVGGRGHAAADWPAAEGLQVGGEVGDAPDVRHLVELDLDVEVVFHLHQHADQVERVERRGLRPATSRP